MEWKCAFEEIFWCETTNQNHIVMAPASFFLSKTNKQTNKQDYLLSLTLSFAYGGHA